MKHCVGIVPFINIAPLVRGLSQSDKLEIIRAAPSELVGMLERDEIDIGMLPIPAYLMDDNLDVLPHMAIGSNGPVLSIRLFLFKEPGEVLTVGLDKSSLTSANMVRIYFKQNGNTALEYQRIDPKTAPDTHGLDAVMLIGDPALRADVSGAGEVVDLGKFWSDHTGLPMVYAAWTFRKGGEVGELTDILLKAKARGLSEIDAIAEENAASVGLAAESLGEYLRTNIRFDLGSQEQSGIEQFQKELIELGLIEKRRTIDIIN